MPAPSGCDGLRLAEAAEELGVPRERVRWWIKRGFVRSTDRRIPRLDIETARRVIEEQRRLGVEATEGLFAYARAHTSIFRAAGS